MNLIDQFMDGWKRMIDTVGPAFREVGKAFRVVGKFLARAWNYLMKFRKIVFAVPVALAAFALATKNMEQLPEIVGLGLQTDGSFSYHIAKELAVLGPVAVTAFCLLLMFCSKRILTPWLVSVISLIVPLALLLTNVFPA